MSSILPPKCEIITKDEGLKQLLPGEIVFCVMSNMRRMNRIGESQRHWVVQFPNPNEFGYISEHHAFGETTESSGAYAERLALSMYETWTESKPKETFNVATSAVVNADSLWTTVLSVAVFLL